MNTTAQQEVTSPAHTTSPKEGIMDSASKALSNNASTLSGDPTARPSKARLWAGRAISAVPAIFLLSGGVTRGLRRNKL